uniref:Uncharacterized protein n=1 Tax=Anguilla anguilla TaxID=7936 RepID=A0A0E9PSR7_ANGAN
MPPLLNLSFAHLSSSQANTPVGFLECVFNVEASVLFALLLNKI